ncbi:hypothetical protein CYMTET_32677, partial [Cymbomonas tetramitiformis]
MPVPVQTRVQEECFSLCVFGASGDLATKKLYPALFNLHCQGFMPPRTLIIGCGRTAYTEDSFREKLKHMLLKGTGGYTIESPPGTPPSAEKAMPKKVSEVIEGPKVTLGHVESFIERCTYVVTTYESNDSFQALFDSVLVHEEDNKAAKIHNRIFYFALPYSVWPQVCTCLKAKNDEFPVSGSVRAVLEKPFGRDQKSAAELMRVVDGCFKEDQVYRIDRYLGKEMLENLLVTRFANRFFAPIWNRDTINTVQIIFKEPFGAEDQNRMKYFDQQGIIRDVIENHLLQVLALVCMDKPASLSVEDIRTEKLKLLRSVKAIKKEDVVIGQYTEGASHPGYQEDPNILGKESTTPTFAMMVVYIRNERWDGVPFILKAGKALNEKRSEIRIQLKNVPGDLFEEEPQQVPNELVVRMQPTEEMYLKMTIKKPGLGMEIVPTEMEYQESWNVHQQNQHERNRAPRRAYERLLMNCLQGDQGRYVHKEELLEMYKIMDPINKMVDENKLPLHSYPYGFPCPTVLPLHSYP